MRADMATLAIAVALGLVCSAQAAPPTYSCFDPPGEGQSNPLGEGLEDVVEEECCEALIDETDIIVGREVLWDPVNCNHGPGENATVEEPFCRAHDTDGCRLCYESCGNLLGFCITCSEMLGFDSTASPTSSPTSTPFELGFGPFSSTFGDTPAPFSLFPQTPSPTAAVGAIEIPTTDISNPGNSSSSSSSSNSTSSEGEGGEVEGFGEGGDGQGGEVGVGEVAFGSVRTACGCLDNLSEAEAEVLAIRGKTLVCDRTCLDGSDLIWGVMNCNYFALGQECRACADSCEQVRGGIWLDQFDAFCKPCSVISS